MEYEYKKLSELGRVVTGKTPPTENSEYYDGDYPFITPSDIESFDEKYLLATERSLSDLGAQELGSLVLPPQSICFVSIGSTIGKMCKTHKRSYTNQQINTLVPNENYDSDYLFYFLRYIKSYFQSIGGGTGSGKGIVNKTVFSKTKVNVLKDKTCQHKMASVLSAYDNLIEVNNKRIKVLEQMAENLYKEWFVRFRFPGHETAEFENGLPASWRKARIADLVSFLNGFAFKSEDYDDAGRYIVVTIKNVQDGYFDMSSVERIGFLPSRMPQYCILKKGDIIMSLTGNVGRVCIVSSDGCLLNQRVCKIESKYPLFAYSFFRQEAVFQMLCNIAYGTAQLNLSPILAGKTRTILPPDELIAQFENKVAELYEAIQNYREQNETLVKQRDLLLPRLMSGKLEV